MNVDLTEALRFAGVSRPDESARAPLSGRRSAREAFPCFQPSAIAVRAASTPAANSSLDRPGVPGRSSACS